MPEELTRSQLQDIIDFSQGILAGSRFYSPFMANELLNNLNNNSQVPSADKIKQALQNYITSAETLQDYTEFMQKWDMVFARMLRSYSDILSFDLQIVPQGEYTIEELNSPEFKEDKKRIYRFLDAFDYKGEFHKMCVEMLRHEVVYTWFRKTKWGNIGMKGTLQIMPQQYCMLTGYWEKGLLYDFDMTYFLNPGVDINEYDPVFKQYYRDMFIDNDGYSKYIPSAPLDKRTGTYALWHQTSPVDGAWVFKFDTSNFNATPFLAPMLKNAFTNEEVAELQKDKDMLAAYAILAGEIRLFDNAKSGTVANQFAIEPKTLGSFMGAVKNGLDKHFKAVAMPTENIDFYQYSDSNGDMYSNHIATTTGVGSSLSRVIYSSDRMSSAEVQYAAETQYHLMKPLYNQFANFLNWFGNKMTRKYKFTFIFDGCAYEFDKDKRFERIMKLADKGIILDPTAYAFAANMRPQDFERSLASAQASQWYAKLGLFPNTNTTSGGVGGRPTVSDTDISESGEYSRNE